MAEMRTCHSSLRKFAEEHLQCAICHSLYRNPKTLTCLHSFCEECLMRCWGSRPWPSANCPICRRAVSIPGQVPCQVKNLPTDFKLASMVEAAVKDDAQTVPTCTKHGGKKCCVFCKTCHQLICFTCMKESHYSHDVGDVGETVEEFKQCAREHMIKCNKSLEDMTKALETVTQTKLDFRMALEIIRQDVSVRAGEEVARITAAKQCILDELNEIQSDREKQLDGNSKVIFSVTKHLQRAAGGFKSLVKMPNDYEFMEKYPKLKAYFSKLTDQCYTESVKSIAPFSIEYAPSARSPQKFNLGRLICHTHRGGEGDKSGDGESVHTRGEDEQCCDDRSRGSENDSDNDTQSDADSDSDCDVDVGGKSVGRCGSDGKGADRGEGAGDSGSNDGEGEGSGSGEGGGGGEGAIVDEDLNCEYTDDEDDGSGDSEDYSGSDISVEDDDGEAQKGNYSLGTYKKQKLSH
ncbi:tripartite motif-containing protein 59-like [Acanthaster planci]|uniref:Tripartite motif-containing protein 59-like n=1 Tax=Acanthaster planci TaxID=133434 RepID=A0A8B7Z687_ACAPL|nr:tripartite motif-containing protein 59-like [Acanthaster planci]XP_022100461.1 tripartite motif-containing protein 59-like [Acanthaster planci]XP_022100462.1 tripartite motif-containing protein 59-like [Acanthaster planci]XP_022100464.1 tripartite motif-containing protein 59-like [Acanthaster planci]